MTRGRLLGAAILGCSVAALAADPAPENPPVVGATELVSIEPNTGLFVDDPVTSDAQRLAYVIADDTGKTELHVLTVATNQEAVVDLAPVTHHPAALHLVGDRVFVVGIDDDKPHAALVELAAHGKSRPAGTVVYKLGPASQIAVITRAGKTRVALDRDTQTDAGTRHDVELVAIETGRRIASARPFEVDSTGYDKQLDFRVNHWSDGMTLAYGIKGGAWDRKEDQRSPDTEATYDLVTGKIVAKKPIQDLFEQRKRFQVLAAAGGTVDFLRMKWNNSVVEIWHDGVKTDAVLDQPIATYAPKSLEGVVERDGSAWIALAVDPVNPAAVARKKADPEYVDVFHAGSDGRAERVARVLAPGLHEQFGVMGHDRFWLLERSSGFARGGRKLTLYQLSH